MKKFLSCFLILFSMAQLTFSLNASNQSDIRNSDIHELGGVFSSTSHEVSAGFSYKDEQDKIIRMLTPLHQESVRRLINQQYPLIACEEIAEENKFSHPWSCHGQLEMIFFDNNSGKEQILYGTGILIDRFHVLTCAHNVFLSYKKRSEVLKNQEWDLSPRCIKLKFRQAKYNKIQINESTYSLDFKYPTEWQEDFNSMFDFAVIKFNDEFEGPYINIQSLDHPQDTLINQPIHFIGYPLYNPYTDSMQEAKALIIKADLGRVYYRIEVIEGSSGSSLFLTIDGTTLFGIHTGIYKINVPIRHDHVSLIDLICSGGVYFDEGQVRLIQEWVAL